MAAASRFALCTGPLFDGRADEAAHAAARAINKELADIGADWVKVDALGMDRSGRGGTGRAAAGVQRLTQGDVEIVRGGIREGEYAWPWLEGISKRNAGTSFKGYHTFRRTRLKLRRKALPYAEEKLREYLPEMGGV